LEVIAYLPQHQRLCECEKGTQIAARNSGGQGKT